jgi:hypothetical protein
MYVLQHACDTYTVTQATGSTYDNTVTGQVRTQNSSQRLLPPLQVTQTLRLLHRILIALAAASKSAGIVVVYILED